MCTKVNTCILLERGFYQFSKAGRFLLFYWKEVFTFGFIGKRFLQVLKNKQIDTVLMERGFYLIFVAIKQCGGPEVSTTFFSEEVLPPQKRWRFILIFF